MKDRIRRIPRNLVGETKAILMRAFQCVFLRPEIIARFSSYRRRFQGMKLKMHCKRHYIGDFEIDTRGNINEFDYSRLGAVLGNPIRVTPLYSN